MKLKGFRPCSGCSRLYATRKAYETSEPGRLNRAKKMLHLSVLLAALALFSQCGGPRYVSMEEVKKEQSVKLYLRNGKVEEGIVTGNSAAELTLISAADHQSHTYTATEISRVEPSATYYDYQAYPISNAEIEKYKSSRNAWAYGVGGAVVGGLVGLAINYPIWVANDDPPPLLGAGIGAVVGSIYFAARGIKKDQQIAVRQVRYLRERESELEQEKQSEEERLREIERQKEELRKKLEEKKKKGKGS